MALQTLTTAKIEDRIRNKIMKSVRHEFGHLVVAKVLGFRTGFITLESHQAGAEIILQPHLPDVAAVSDYARRRVQVLYAGVCAELLQDAKVDHTKGPGLLQTSAKDDHAKIRELLRVVCGLKSPAAADGEEFNRLLAEIDEELVTKAVTLVEDHARLIVDLSKFFMDRRGSVKAGATPVKFTLDAKDIDAYPGVSELAPASQ